MEGIVCTRTQKGKKTWVEVDLHSCFGEKWSNSDRLFFPNLRVDLILKVSTERSVFTLDAKVSAEDM